MNELMADPVFWQAALVLTIFFVVFFKIYKWFEHGGAYNRKYPIAAKMDEMAKSGKLDGKDVEAAIFSVDLESDKEDQVKQFESAISAQK